MEQSVHPMHTSADGMTPSDPAVTYDKLSVTASFTTAPFFVARTTYYSLSFSVVDVTASGTLKIQGCNDPSKAQPDVGDYNLTNWFDIPFVDSTGAMNTSQAVSGSGTIVLNETHCAYRWIRVAYTYAAGTSIITIRVQFKGGFA